MRLIKYFFSGFCNNVPDGPLTQSGRDTLLASPPLEAERRAETSLAAPAADTSATSERKSSSCGSEQNNDIFKDLSEFDPDDTEDSGLQCGHCSDKFMSEPTLTSVPVISLSSGLDYEDTLIDDDYSDQQQLIISSSPAQSEGESCVESDMELELDDIKVEVESNEDELVCEICSKEFNSKKSLTYHRNSAHKLKEYTCMDCGKELIGSKKYHDHRRSHKTFECPKCSESHPVKNRYRHMEKCDGSSKTKTKEKMCDQCEYVTTNSSNFKKHLLTHIRHQCEEPHCDYLAKSVKKLEVHKKKVHREAPVICATRHQCGYCDFEGKFPSYVARHEKICSMKKQAECQGIQLLPFTNEELGKMFSNTSSCSIRDFNLIMDHIKEKIGAHWFEKSSYDAVSKYCRYNRSFKIFSRECKNVKNMTFSL